MILCMAVMYLCLSILPIHSKEDFLMVQDTALDNSVIDNSYCLIEEKASSKIRCAIDCLHYPMCKSVFYNLRTQQCNIYDETFTVQNKHLMITSKDSVYLHVIDGLQTGVQTCKELKSCNTQYGDGEYWLYPSGNSNRRTKIYCHNMTEEEPKEYITLLNKDDNESIINGSNLKLNSPCSWGKGTRKRALFRKIRINPTNMEVNRQDVTFADLDIEAGSLSFRDIEYAFGLGCSGSLGLGICPKMGYFKIDTTGTGLIVSPSVTFSSSGFAIFPMDFYKSGDNHVIWAKCDGYCGRCMPDGPLILTNAQVQVDPAMAMFPRC